MKYKAGDIVEIYADQSERSKCMPHCPVLNLEGSICRIKSFDGGTYGLEFIEVHAEDISLFEEDWQGNMAWTDKHLIEHKEYPEMDTLELFNE